MSNHEVTYTVGPRGESKPTVTYLDPLIPEPAERDK